MAFAIRDLRGPKGTLTTAEMATSQLHEDFSREEHVKAGSDRGFGFVFAGFFASGCAFRSFLPGSEGRASAVACSCRCD